MIVNRSHPYEFFLLRLESLLPSDKNFYRFDFNYVNFVPVIEKAKSVINENLNILLDCGMEGYKSFIPNVYQELVINLGISEDNIFLVSGAADIQQIVSDVAKKFNKKPFFSVWMREFEYMIAGQLQYQLTIDKSYNYDTLTEHRLNQSGFIKSFLNLNKRWRLHRPTLVSMFAKRNILDRGFVSLADNDVEAEWDDIIDSILSTHKDCEEIYNYFTNNKSTIKKLTPLTIDKPSLKISDAYNLTNDLISFYENSYFSVVTETNYYYNTEKYASWNFPQTEATRFLSEKTFKPMVYKHPFVLVSVPNMLSLLRDIGYETFHPYINEDYDKEPDDDKRIIMILDEVCRLCSLSDKDLRNFLINTKEICEHNFKTLLSRYDTLFHLQNLFLIC